MNKKLVYVDTDVGLGTPGAEIDDGAALIFLSRNPQVDIVGVGSVYGNVPVQDADINLDRLLTWLGARYIPRGLGSARPLLENTAWFKPWQSQYGKTLAWNHDPVTQFAASLLIDTIHTHPGEVSILSLGPMTNLALAVRLDPAIVPLTRAVIVMGGSSNAQKPIPEFNVRSDPEAAHIVFGSGWPLHILGLDITRRVHFSRRDFASLPNGNSAVELLREQAPAWIDRMEEMGWEQNGCALHDAVAAAYLADDSLFNAEDARVDVELANPHSRGLIRFHPATEDAPVVKVITDLDTAGCHDLIWSHLQQ